MSTKAERMQKFARHYREKHGRDVTMREVAKAESEEIKYDEVTGDPYRANICYDEKSGGKQQRLWGDR